MNKVLLLIISSIIIAGCNDYKNSEKRIPVAQVDKVILYYDELPNLILHGINDSDSAAIIQNYLNKWTKRQLLLKRAEDNLSDDLEAEIAKQLSETRTNLVIYQYQRQMMLEKMDTVISEAELEKYYADNENSFELHSNIVKALFIKLPLETPNMNRIKVLAHSNEQEDLQELETYCYQFAEKFDDFNEDWVTMDRLSVELQEDIENEENFLQRNTFLETSDSASVYLLSIKDYRLRSTTSPYEFVKDDIKRIIWNTRRIDFIQSLENGIYNEALKENNFNIY